MRFSVKRPAIPSASVAAEAARWMARRDRGLTAAEQDSYLQWLCGDRAHPPAILRLEKIWSGLGAVRHWPATASVDDDSPRGAAAARRVWRRRWIQSVALVAGGIAAIVIALAW